MRKIWRTGNHIKFAACAMAVIVGLLPPCAAIAAEETTAEEESPKEDTAAEEMPEEDSASEGETTVTYITAFEPLTEEDALISCMEKPGLDELAELFPETLTVWMEGEEASASLEVDWESEEDFEETKQERYTFYPKWDETLYAVADSAADTIEIPTITVEVPVEKGMIPELEEAKSALKDIIENKSILALVYLCDTYEVKTGAAPDADTVQTVVSGQSVQIMDAELDESGNVWYQALFYQNGTEYTGYIERGYLAASDEDFLQWEETYIVLPPAPKMMRSRRAAASYPDVDQFPASYQNALYGLKAKHPNWIFVRMDTGIDWNTAISREMGDKSLIPSTSSGSWQNGIYGQGWSYASEGILKYYMDPRNFLTDPAVFQFEQLTYNDSYHTASAVQEILKNSFMSSTIPGDSRTYAQAFNEIGQSTGVSPFHLASRVLQEQGKGTSPLISGAYPGYEGYYNYFNVGASGKTDALVIQSGLKKAKEQGWNTRYKSLNGGARVIGANYILKGQDTLYLEKFNVASGYHANFTHQYMQNIQAPDSEASKIRNAYNSAGALENGFVFKIPVYSNMPASPCSKPNMTDTITLDQTTVSGLQVNKTVKLIPCINGSKVDYISNMTFSSDNPSVATVDSVGKVTAISPGSAVISCTRSGTGTAVCTVTVVKADPDVATPTLSPGTYREGLRLADISLPDGWKWVKENTSIGAGTHSFEAVYTPEDTTKYNTVTRNLSFTVSKAVPACKMPEELKVSAGLTLGEIVLPDGFVWESDTETKLQESGEYTFYVIYNPDENNYHPVKHIPLVVQVAGEASKPDEDEGTSSGGNTGTGTGSGTDSGSNTGSGSGGTSSGGNTGTGTGSGTDSGSNTGTGMGSGSGGTSSGGNTGTGSGTDSGSNTGTGTESGSGGTSSGGNTSTTAGSSNAGAPLKELPKNTEPTKSKDKGDGAKSGNNQSKKDEAQNGTDSNNQQVQSGTDNSQPQVATGGSQPSQETAAGGSQPAQETAAGGSQPAQETAAGNSQPAQNEAGSSQSTKKTEVTSQSRRSERKNADDETAEEKVEAQEEEESYSKPAVTMSMDDTTILTSEILQMAKDQNLDLLLNMGKYATWSIDIDEVDPNTIAEVDMGISLGTENVPTELIQAILDGNKYLEFTLAHDGSFGFHPLLRVALDPMYEGWYANLFYYNEDAETLEFICDAMIDSDGIAEFDMEHASSYVIIVSPVSMAGTAVPDGAVTGDTGSHAMRWIVIGGIVGIIAVGTGCGIFFYRKRRQEETEEEEYEEAGEEEYEEAEEEEYEEAGEEEYEETEEEEYEEAGEEEYEEAGEEEYEEAEEEAYEYSEEDDWIEDEDWQEPESPEVTLADRFADDHAEDDWIDDDEWDIGNDWIDDAEWEKRKEA